MPTIQNELADTTLNATALMYRFVLPHVFFSRIQMSLGNLLQAENPQCGQSSVVLGQPYIVSPSDQPFKQLPILLSVVSMLITLMPSSFQ